jgi:MFS family permease
VRSGFGLILPGLPLYIRAHAIPVPDLGLASATYMAAAIAGMLLLAPLADRFGHVRALFGGGALYVAGALVLLLAPSAPSLMCGRGLQGLAMALFTPATFAYIGASVAPERRGGAYGVVASAQMSGFILGPALGGVALGVAGPAGPLALAAAAAALTVLVAAALPAEPPPRPGEAVGTAATAPARGIAAITAPLAALAAAPWGVGFLAYTVGQQIPNGVYDTVWSLYMFHLGAAPWLVGASFATWALPLVILSPVLGRRASGGHVRLWMTVGGAVMAVAAATYAVLTSPYAVAAVGFLEGTGSAAVLPLSQIYLAQRVPPQRMAGLQGAAGALGQAAALCAAAVSGYVFPVRPWLPFAIAAVALAAGTWVFARRGEAAPAAAAAPGPGVAG